MTSPGGPLSQPAAAPLINHVWTVRSRARNTLLLTGEIDDYIQLEMWQRFNSVGAFILTLPHESPNVALLPPWSGIVVYRDGQYFFSGPVTAAQRQGALGGTYIASGLDDLCWVAFREAWPVPSTVTYFSVVNADAPARLYQLTETTGTTAVDGSANAQNGTINGSVTLNQPGLYDSGVNPSMLFWTTPSIGYISFPATGLPTGNAVWSLEIWCYYGGTPILDQILLTFGNQATAKGAPQIYVHAADQTIRAGVGGTDAVGSTLLTINQVHHFVATWDGTTLKLYQDAVNTANATPGALVVANPPPFATIGGSAASPPTSTAACYLAGAAVYPTVLSQARVTAHYQRGITRFFSASNDTRSGPAETVIRQYVNLNAGPGAVGARVTPNFTLDTDLGRGPTVSAAPRFDQLVAADGSGLIQSLARTGNLGFRVIQTGATLQFQVYQPNVKTGSVILSPELGNLLDWTYTQEAPGANDIIVAGSGVGIARMTTESIGDLVNNPRIEAFQDERNTSDAFFMRQKGGDTIVASQAKAGLTIKPQDTAGMQFGRDYGLGDKVTVIVESTVQAKIGLVQPLTLYGNYKRAASNLYTAASMQPGSSSTSQTTQQYSFLGTSTGYGEMRAYGRWNLLSKNQSDVETDLTGFTVKNSSTLTRVTTQFQQGTASLQVITTTGGNAYKGVYVPLPSQNYTPGQTVTISVYMLGAVGGEAIRMLLWCDNPNTDFSPTVMTLTTAWARYSLTVTLPPTLAQNANYGILLDTGAGNAAVTFYVDALQIESGPSASAFIVGNVSDNGGWAALGSIGTPTGRGWLWDDARLETQRMAGGTYQPHVRLRADQTITADIYARFYIRSAAGVYTLLATSSLLGQSLTTTDTTFNLPAVSAPPSAVFNPGDRLYMDLWLNVTVNGTTGINVQVDGEANPGELGNSTNEWDTPGYQTFSPALPAAQIQDTIQEVHVTLAQSQAELVEPQIGVPPTAAVLTAFQRLYLQAAALARRVGMLEKRQ